MRIKFCGLTTLPVVFLWAANGLAQSPSQSQTLCDASIRSQPRTATLLARSEMQRPKPLPIVRPLRFQEIPVNAEAPRLEDREDKEDKSVRFDSTEGYQNQIEKEQSQLPFASDGAR